MPRSRRVAALLSRGGEARHPGLGGREAGHERERHAELLPRGAVVAAAALQLAQQRADVRVVLRRGPAGRDGEAHRGRRALEVAVQLAQIGDAGVGGEVGLAVDHRLQLACVGGGVAAELDERVDADERAHVSGAHAEPQRALEVMSRQCELAGGGESVGRARVAQDALGAGVVGRVAGLPHALQVGGGQGGAQVLAVRGPADGALQLGDVRRRSGQHGALDRRRRRGPAALRDQEDGEADAERESDDGERLEHQAGGCGTGAWAGSTRPNFASKPLSGRATYGNEVRNGFSFWSTPSPSGICLPPSSPAGAGDDAQLDVRHVVGQTAAVREALRVIGQHAEAVRVRRSAGRRG